MTVRDLQVLYVCNETDGDWHVAVTDGRLDVFITEIIPSDQQPLGRPSAGAVIDETGTVYCDTAHQTEAWHGKHLLGDSPGDSLAALLRDSKRQLDLA